MKITMAQINPTVGALDKNARKISEAISRAEQAGSDLVVFPELAITGYPPQDLIFENGFVSQNKEILHRLAKNSDDTAVVLGFIEQKDSRYYNAVALIQNGEIIAVRYKTLLPTYDVFDEQRYFTPGEMNFPVKFRTISGECYLLGLEICEDLWDADRERKVTDELCGAGADLIINISASPYSEGKRELRRKLVEEKVRRFRKPFIYVNLIGGQDELVFDGSSFAVNGENKIIGTCKPFEEDIVHIDFDADIEKAVYPHFRREDEIFRALVLGTRDYFHKSGFKQAIVGLSGGIDSALTAVIGKEALGSGNVLAVSMPSSYSSESSVTDAQILADNLGINFKLFRIEDIFRSYLQLFSDEFKNLPEDITEENIQARIRGNILMALANKYRAMVLVTGNKTELALGYCTLYGDMCGALGIISDINKMDVYAICRWYNESMGKEIIPESILTKTPSAELKANQYDPFDYPVVSPLVEKMVEDNKGFEELEREGYSHALLADLHSRIRLSEYKRRQAAPGIKISAKAFGFGRRYPIINHFKKE